MLRSLRPIIVFASLFAPVAAASDGCVLVRGRDPIPMSMYDGTFNGLGGIASDGRYVVFMMGVDANFQARTVFWYDEQGDRTVRVLENPSDRNIQFGSSIAVVDGIAYIGARSEWVLNVPAVGGVYVFDLETGMEIGHIAPPEFVAFGFFGTQVHVHGDHLFIRSSSVTTTEQVTGTVYMYNRHTYEFIREVAPDYLYNAGNYGRVSDSTSDTIVFSEPGRRDEFEFDRGSCFLVDPLTGEILQELQAAGRSERRFFGYQVAISDEYFAATAGLSIGPGPYTDGLVQVFDRATGSLLYELSDRWWEFDNKLELAGPYLLVGASYCDSCGADGGSVRVYNAADGRLLQAIERDKRPDGSSPWFGGSIVKDGDRIFVGNIGLRINGTQGYYETWVLRASMLDLAEPAGVIDDADFAAFVAAFVAGDRSADIAEPYDELNFADVIRYAGLFNGGCE